MNLEHVIGYSKAKQHPAWESFVAEVCGRDYDFFDLNLAWALYKAGWESCYKAKVAVW